MLVMVVERMPISSLELSNFGHAICALLTYVIRWKKPFEVDHAIVLRDKAVDKLFALAWMVTPDTP